jgi:menaquinone-dependent protoporphyrinogen oxidase
VSRVLVAYATRHGSTREVAEAVATAIQAAGGRVEVAPAAAVRKPPRGFDLVILGGSIYSGRWHRDAHRFLKRHRAALAPVPVAVFGMGPRRGEQLAWQRSRAQLDRALARRDWLVPIASAVFGGADPAGGGHRPRRDQRDWAVIGDWARQLLARLEPAGSRPD